MMNDSKMTYKDVLRFPASAAVMRNVPKNAFYKHLGVNAKMKLHFTDDVASITWLYKLAPSTINVTDGREVHEIVVFLFLLKNKEFPEEVFTLIDRNMPRHVLFLLQYEERYRLLLNYKEWADETAGTFRIIKTFATGWVTADKVDLPFEGQDMDKVYEVFAGSVSGFGTKSVEKTRRAIGLQEQIQMKTRQAESLQKKIRLEKQFNLQVEMNTEARALKKSIKELQNELKQITTI